MTPSGSTLIVDTHVHVCSADRSRYRLAPTGIGSDWWAEDDVDVEALLRRMDLAGVDRAVLVQAVGPYGFDNSYALDSAAVAPERLGTVVAVNLDEANATDQIAAYAQLPAVVGVRFFGMTSAQRWIGSAATTRMLSIARESGLTVVVTVPGERLAELRDQIIEAETPVVLDHCGFPEYSDGLVRADAAIWALSPIEHVSLKVTTHSFLHSTSDGVRLIAQLCERFGPDRLMWGSDYPQTTRHDYEAPLRIARRACRSLAPDHQAAFLGGSALRLFSRRERHVETATVHSVRTALRDLTDALAADSYVLEIESVRGDVVTLAVRAGDHACADCLVPRSVFTAIVADRIATAHRSGRLSVELATYPNHH